ncbi:RDD family protein [Alteribacter aurantiacus]|uniref:RDD family protein n=1 Tax=Alteribacter aurantiacus TaxID=254410 RepID=UPI00047BB3C4|nr:RDD family protein [Alteribacter aurantiacus]
MNASFLLRFKAFMIDYIVILIYLSGLLVVSLFLYPSIQQLFNGSLFMNQLFGFLLVTLPISVYFIISDSKIGTQSFGKRKSGIRVVDMNGEPLSVSHNALRTVLKFLPWELSHFAVYRFSAGGEVALSLYLLTGVIYTLIFIYIVTAIFSKRRQSLYDFVLRTQVVRV